MTTWTFLRFRLWSILGTLLCFFILGFTSVGLKSGVYIAQHLLPGSLTVERIDGYLLGHIQANHIRYRSQSLNLHIDTVDLNWDPLALFTNTLHLIHLNAHTVDIKTQPTQDKTTSLPFKIHIDTAKVHQASFDASDKLKKSVQINTLYLREFTLPKNIQWKNPFQKNSQLFTKHIKAQWGDNQLSLKGGYDHQWDLQWTIRLHRLADIMPDTHGKLDTTGKITGTPNALAFAIDAKLPSFEKDNYSLRNVAIELKGSQAKHQLRAQWINHTDQFAFRVQGGYTPEHWKGTLDKLLVIAPEQSWHLEKAALDIKLNKSTLQQLHLKHGTLAFPQWGVTATPVQLSVKQLKPRLFNLALSANTPTGALTVEGLLSHKEQWRADLHLTGQNVQVLKNREYNVRISPDFQFHLLGNDVTLTGSMDIPKAHIAPHDFSDTLELPSEVNFIQHKNVKATTPWRWKSRILFRLGEDIQIAFHGLQAHIAGELTIQDAYDKEPTAQGELRIIKGHYKAYGKNLTVQTGRLLYTDNSLSDPGLDITAFREVTFVRRQVKTTQSTLPNHLSQFTEQPNGGSLIRAKVGLHVSGTLEEPRFTLYSIPSNLSQTDILSLLVLNRPASNISTTNSEQLFSSLSALSLAGSAGATLKLQDSLQDKLKLDVIDVQSTPHYDTKTKQLNKETSVVLGKSLSPRLFISYAIGLADAEDIFSARYLLSRHWTLQGETKGSANSVDLLYNIEKD